MSNNYGGAKKSLYVFLSSILGALLFLILHRLIFITYLLLYTINPDAFNLGLSLLDVMALDIVSLVIFLMLGAWYGTWLGLHWYDMVYEQGLHSGFANYVYKKLFNGQNNSFGTPDAPLEEFKFPTLPQTNFDESFWSFEEPEKVVKIVPTITEVKVVAKKRSRKPASKTKSAK